MKKLLVVVGLALAAVLGAASPSSAAGQVCYDVNITAQGSPVVAEAACQPLP